MRGEQNGVQWLTFGGHASVQDGRTIGGKKPSFNYFFVSIVVVVGTLIIVPLHPLPKKKKQQNTYIEKLKHSFSDWHLQVKLMHFMDR